MPVLDGASIQWVLNTLVGAWTRWEGLSVASMCEWEGDLYFGMWTEGTVCKVAGYTDNVFRTDPLTGEAIGWAAMVMAFYFGKRGIENVARIIRR